MVITEFGNPILRQVANELSVEQIRSPETQQLIVDMQTLLKDKKLGVGLAAPQVGIGKSLAIIGIQPTKHRPEAKVVNLVIINPVIVRTFGNRKQMYEGCISGGAGKAGLFATVPRHKKLILAYYDENGDHQEHEFEGLTAHVIQHEVDHLNGVLFVDRVTDTSSYMTQSEYLKHAKKRASAAPSKHSA